MRPPYPFRQIHLDFHTSEHIEGVGADFDPQQFVDTLKKGNVDGINLFARCHHGWSYYPSEIAPPHPHLEREDLLGEMIEACKAADIRVQIYTTVQWDERVAREHFEWRVVPPHAGEGDPLQQLTPTWHTLCLAYEPYNDFLVQQGKELVERYQPDGMWYDIVPNRVCVCTHCIARMQRDGRDPASGPDAYENFRELILEFYEKCNTALLGVNPDLRIFYNGGHMFFGDRDRMEYFTHFDIESLPTAIWGYDHYPLSARYAATLGKEYLGMTGKFHHHWGEFGGFKRPEALTYECARIVALGGTCCIGDQLHPRGELEEATYENIAPAYAHVRDLEPVCRDAKLDSDVAMLIGSAIHYPRRTRENHRGHHPGLGDWGCLRVLQELHMPFDVVDEKADLSRYRLLVLPDTVTLDEALAKTIQAYLDGGGSLLLSGTSGMTPACDAFALPLRARIDGESPFSPDYIDGQKAFDPDLVNSPFVMTERARKVKADGAEVLLGTRLPYDNRTWDHFCSHLHFPPRPEGNETYDAALQDGRVIYLSHPVFTEYYKRGNPYVKYLVRGAIRRLLPDPKATASLPSNGLLSLTRQEAEGRSMLHLVFAHPHARAENMNPGHRTEIVEDIVPIHDIACTLRTPQKPSRVRLAVAGEEIPFEYADGTVRFTVPRVHIHEVAVIED